MLAYTADGNVDTYTDPGGVTDYEWDATNRLASLTGPANKKTTYEYDSNDARTKTTYPGNTVQSVTLDNSGRPTGIRNIGPSGRVASDLSYTYAYTAGTESLDGIKIRSLTDNLSRTRTTYQYDSAGRPPWPRKSTSRAARPPGSTATIRPETCSPRAASPAAPAPPSTPTTTPPN
ncbi:RHS repeat domain-containing protein [Streptomyces sviceus]|uniref:RHS repeat domain-containing protein n=1 Tax=Streptomyces sviceus TaxID=285530 RepID=UPI0036A01B3B